MLDLYNLIISMKKNRKILAITSILLMGIIWAFIALQSQTGLFKGLDLFIFILIVVLGVIAMVNALKKDKKEKDGVQTEDELSQKMKFKSGYYAYLASMYMWLFIFLFKRYFPDVETMLGGGILLSALIGYIAKLYVNRSLND